MIPQHTIQYDLIIIGNDSEAMSAAIQAARANCRVAIVGGDSLTPPPQFIAGIARNLFQENSTENLMNLVNSDPHSAMSTIRSSISDSISQHKQDCRSQSSEWGIDLFEEAGSFMNSHEIVVGSTILTGNSIIVSTGTRAHLPAYLECNGFNIVSSDELLQFSHLPESLVIVGGGSIGMKAADCYSQLGASITFIDRSGIKHENINISSLHDEVIGIDQHDTASQSKLHVHLANGKHIETELVAVNVGRYGNTEHLNLSQAQLTTDDRGKLWCNREHQTWTPHIYGLGDVAGMCDEQLPTTDLINQIIKQPVSPAEHPFCDFALS